MKLSSPPSDCQGAAAKKVAHSHTAVYTFLGVSNIITMLVVHLAGAECFFAIQGRFQMDKTWEGPLEKVSDFCWRIPVSYKPGMRVPGIIFLSEEMLPKLRKDAAPEQVANVAYLPGILKASYAMPDIHWGYGFPIGGVAATDIEAGGVISPGGVGYDINCGVRIIRTNLSPKDVKPRMNEIIEALFRGVPLGVGSKGSLSLSPSEERAVLAKGARWVVERGMGTEEDLLHCEAGGRMEGAVPDRVSQKAKDRGRRQVGTLGSGNHFVEVQLIEKIFDQNAAQVMGLAEGGITVMIHSGSRGLGHQVCQDAINSLSKAPQKYGISIPDRQLVCAPVESPEGQAYFEAMACAANYAWANRQMLTHLVRKILARLFGAGDDRLGLELIYDVAHNIAKVEKHAINGQLKTVCVHRKGATRAFPPGHPEVPARYRSIGQPIIIPGDMGTASYLLLGTQTAMEETFGSTCHGAGRVMSRTQAIRIGKGRNVRDELRKQGITVMAPGWQSIAEEAPYAYKEVDDVVETVQQAGLSTKVARLTPLGVIKG